jgi:hypothetical protein
VLERPGPQPAGQQLIKCFELLVDYRRVQAESKPRVEFASRRQAKTSKYLGARGLVRSRLPLELDTDKHGSADTNRRVTYRDIAWVESLPEAG